MRIHARKAALTAAAFGIVEIGVASPDILRAQTTQVEIGASQDATLLGGIDASTNNSLADPGIFVGTDGEGNPKRGLIEFNIAAAVPAGATITSVQLQLTVGQVAGSGGGNPNGNNGAETISLFDESQAWGQPTNFFGQATFPGTGHGAAPQPGDATWTYSFYNSNTWTVAGGDWTSSLPDRADANVYGTLASFTWSSGAMVTDVQNWLNNPATNFGWLLKNADETDPTDFRAFWSAQGAAANNNPALAPQLFVTYTAGPPATAYWSGAQSGAAGLVWSTQLGSPDSPSTNWSATDGGPDLHAIPGGGVTNVLFGAAGNSAGPLSTTLGADFNINSLTFTSARTNSVTISGTNSLTIQSGGITVQPASAAHTIDTTGVVLGASQTWTNNSTNTFTVQSNIGDGGAASLLTIAGSGTVSLAGSNSYSGGTSVHTGTLILANKYAIPPVGAFLVGGTSTGALAQFAPGIGRVILGTAASLNVTSGNTLDITSNALILNYTTDPVAAIVAALTTGAAFNGSQATWTGTGITSSTAALSISDPSMFAGRAYVVGYLDGNSTYDSLYHTVAANQVLIKYTIAGDAFLENSVGFHDLLSVAQHYQTTGNDFAQGNFYYNSSGSVGFADLLAVAQSYGQSFNLVSATDGGSTIGLGWQQTVSAVPEPGSIAIATAVAAGLMARRRHRTHS